MSITSTRETLLRYLNSEHGDTSSLAPDVIFTTMATGETCQGPAAVQGMLHYLYHVAFEATVETRVMLFGEDHAMFEGDFVGKHTGDFAGIPATGKDVRVPICVVYDIAHDQITHARVYFEIPALLQQLGVPAS